MLKFAPFYSEDDLRRLASQNHFYPQRSSGQNFLIDETVYRKILESAGLKSSDSVLEVGAGFGSLTIQIAQNVKKVWAIELDRRLVSILKKLALRYPAISVIHGDALKLNIPELTQRRKYKIAANIPYNITSFFIRMILELDHKPQSIVLLVQKEIAERMTAAPGGLSLFGLSVQFYSTPEIIDFVPRTSFWPKPEVESAIIRLVPRAEKDIFKRLGCDLSPKFMFRCMRIGFSSKRKVLRNNLRAGFQIQNREIRDIFRELRVPFECRAQELSLDQWIELSHRLQKVAV